ncbi:MAG: hypothetical protein KJ578_03980 [Bacteroidetes bacterium]|nr:hypothetical protein [Bacteroidota bacterium]MBU2465683.1 hypothetical protein [Bacteroidota bacterium]MBU2556920.1 hypothetical protein [Bacteroidota bacterium]
MALKTEQRYFNSLWNIFRLLTIGVTAVVSVKLQQFFSGSNEAILKPINTSSDYFAAETAYQMKKIVYL